MAVFILIYRSPSYRWAAVVPRSNWQSWALSRKTHTYIMLLPMCTWKKKIFTLSFNLVKVQDCCIFKFIEILGYILSYHPIQALTGFYFIGRIRFWLGLLFFFFFFFFFESSIEQVLATTPHETPTIRTLAPHHENYTCYTNQTRGTLLEKQGRAHKWCTPMDPHIWPCKSRTTSSNLHTATMWGHRM